MKSALYTYSTPNIGDDFQSYVMAGIAGQPDVWIDRDQAGKYEGDECRLIANAYMTVEAFPISQRIRPEFVAVHLGGMENPLPEWKLAYLKDNAERVGPIGCRDRETFHFFDRAKVPCYFAGCPTSLCEPSFGVETSDMILFVDVDPLMFGKLNRQQHVRWLTQRVVTNDRAERQELCRSRHRLYSAAKLVVTSKIHVALPCLGMGKPVIFVRQNIMAPGRLGALPEGFKTYEVGSSQLWEMDLEPQAHQFDARNYRQHVRSHLMQRLPWLSPV
jgi:hypothetical protein